MRYKGLLAKSPTKPTAPSNNNDILVQRIIAKMAREYYVYSGGITGVLISWQLGSRNSHNSQILSHRPHFDKNNSRGMARKRSRKE